MPKSKSNAVCQILSVLAAVAAVNTASVWLDVRWDVTRWKLHTLSSDTKEFLGDIKAPVKITVFFSGTPPRYLKDLLAGYQEHSRQRISFEIIDPLVDLGYASQFGSTIDAKQKKIFFRSGEKSSEVDFTGEELSEDAVNFGLMRLFRPLKTACFTAGHREYKIDDDGAEGLSKFRDRLRGQNIQAREIVWGMNPEIPCACDILVIAGPRELLTDRDVNVVNMYLDSGRDALFLIEHTVLGAQEAPLTEEQKQLNPSLNEILEPWGLRVALDVVVDTAAHISGDPGTPATRNYMSHPALIKDLDYTFYMRPRSISMRPGRPDTIKLAPFVLTASTDTSWGETNRNLFVKYDEGIDARGPVAIAYVAAKARKDEASSDTRLIVFTDADFLSNAFVDQFSNARMGLNVMNWLADVDFRTVKSSVSSESKTPRLDLTGRQKMIVGIILAALPLAILIAGIVVWLRRRE